MPSVHGGSPSGSTRPTCSRAVFGSVVCLYAVLPQSWLDGSADHSAIGLALKHDLVPVGAYFLGRSVDPPPRGARAASSGRSSVPRLRSSVLGLLDDFLVPISWWRNSAVVDYFHKHLGYDYHGTGGSARELRLQQRRRHRGLLPPAGLDVPRTARKRVHRSSMALLLAAAFSGARASSFHSCAVVAAGLLFTFSRSSLACAGGGLRRARVR